VLKLSKEHIQSRTFFSFNNFYGAGFNYLKAYYRTLSSNCKGKMVNVQKFTPYQLDDEDNDEPSNQGKLDRFESAQRGAEKDRGNN